MHYIILTDALYLSMVLNRTYNAIFSAHRRNSRFRIFGGLWFGEEKPFFSTFLKPFVETFKKTEVQGNRLQSIDITGYWVFIIAKRSTLNHFFDQHYKLLCSVYLLHSSII